MTEGEIAAIEARTLNAPHSSAVAGEYVPALVAEYRRLREALAWYAEPRRYLAASGHEREAACGCLVAYAAVFEDGGERARAALEGREQ